MKEPSGNQAIQPQTYKWPDSLVLVLGPCQFSILHEFPQSGKCREGGTLPKCIKKMHYSQGYSHYPQVICPQGLPQDPRALGLQAGRRSVLGPKGRSL